MEVGGRVHVLQVLARDRRVLLARYYGEGAAALPEAARAAWSNDVAGLVGAAPPPADGSSARHGACRGLTAAWLQCGELALVAVGSGEYDALGRACPSRRAASARPPVASPGSRGRGADPTSSPAPPQSRTC